MTPDVKHMKWWGWGEEGVFFNYLNKPGFAPFVKKALAVDLRPRKVDTIAFDPTTVPDSPLPMSLRDALVAAAPGHVAQVRASLIDAVTPEQLQQLGDICDAILDRIDPDGVVTSR